MALHGEGEPQPTLLQQATQAATIELFTQWQTYRNGVHMDWDTFRSVNFKAIALAVMTASGFEFTADDVPDMPKLRALLARPSAFAQTPGQAEVTRRVAESARRNGETDQAMLHPHGLSPEAIAEHAKQVQG